MGAAGMSTFDQDLATLPPRPPIRRGIPSAAEREWFTRYYLGLFPKDGPDLLKRSRKRSEASHAK